MPEPVTSNGELQRQRIAKSEALPSRIELSPELEKVRGPILSDAIDHSGIANALEIAFHDEPLVVQAGESLSREKIRYPAGFMTGEKSMALLWNRRKLR